MAARSIHLEVDIAVAFLRQLFKTEVLFLRALLRNVLYLEDGLVILLNLHHLRF